MYKMDQANRKIKDFRNNYDGGKIFKMIIT